MADLDALIQGGVIAAGVSVASAFLTYRVAMRQTAAQAQAVAVTSELDREKFINDTAEQLRKGLLEEIQRLHDQVAGIQGENRDLRQRIDEQDDRIFALRTRLARYEMADPSAQAERRQRSEPPPSGTERRRPLR